MITTKQTKNMNIDIRFVQCIALMLSLVGLLGSFFLNQYANSSLMFKKSFI